MGKTLSEATKDLKENKNPEKPQKQDEAKAAAGVAAKDPKPANEKPAKGSQKALIAAIKDRVEGVDYEMIKVKAHFAEGHFGFNNTTLRRIRDGDVFMHPSDQVSDKWMTIVGEETALTEEETEAVE